jgi:hypothetical protein
MRLGVFLSSQYITDDLAADFGKIVPSDLPLANQPLSSHQIESIQKDCDNVVFTLPEGYTSKWIKNDVIYCPVGLSLRDVIDFVTEVTTEASEYIFYFGDTLLSIEYSPNSLYIGKPNYSYPTWFYINESQVFAGAFTVNRVDLTEYLSRAVDTDTFLSQLVSSLGIVSAKTWFDLGNYATYYNGKKRFLESRKFNSIRVSSDSILTKHSSDFAKIFYEYNWLNIYSNKFPASCPTPKNFVLFGDSASYDLEYFALPTLADLYVYGTKSDDFWKQTLIRCGVLIEKFQQSQVIQQNKGGFYLAKVEERKTYSGYQYLGVEYDFLEAQRVIARELDSIDDKLVGGHGDFCFSNLLFDTRTQTVKALDPRGYLSRDLGQSLVVPFSYDIYKLAHSMIAGYDYVIASGKVVTNELFVSDFEAIFNISRKRLYAGLSHLFFTMIPLHSDRLDRQKNFVELTKKYYADYTNCGQGKQI